MSRAEVESVLGRPNAEGPWGLGSRVLWYDTFEGFIQISEDTNGIVVATSTLEFDYWYEFFYFRWSPLWEKLGL
ncbi:MAG: hypothetical protein ACJ8C4_13360 [Gemmataceae bacterium]